MISDEILKKVVGNELRLYILEICSKKKLNITQIQEQVNKRFKRDYSYPAIWRHINILAKLEMVEVTKVFNKKGKNIFVKTKHKKDVPILSSILASMTHGIRFEMNKSYEEKITKEILRIVEQKGVVSPTEVALVMDASPAVAKNLVEHLDSYGYLEQCYKLSPEGKSKLKEK